MLKLKKLSVVLFVCILSLFVVVSSFVGWGDVVVSDAVFDEFDGNDDVRVLVRFKGGASDDVVASVGSLSDSLQEKMRHSFYGAVSMEISEGDLRELRDNPNVESVILVERVRAFLQEAVPLIGADTTHSLVFSGSNLTGGGQSVCVIDTGVDFTHPDLVSSKLIDNVDCIDGGALSWGADSCSVNASATDDNGHGTHVAGIVGADGSIIGVAPDVGLIGVKALGSDGSGFSDDIVAGINWCVANSDAYNISVISMSLGGNSHYGSYCDSSDTDDWNYYYSNAINGATAKNISVVVATGNDANHTGISSPACIQNAISVGSVYKKNYYSFGFNSCTDTHISTDDIACYSNRNAITDLLAPGSLINSTRNGGGYVEEHGTSMATPMVSGVIALVNQFLELDGRTMTPSEILDVLNETGKFVNDSGYSNLGFSRVDVYSAVSHLETTPNVLVGDFVDNGDGTKNVSAVDDYSMVTTMNSKIQNSNVCSDSVPDDAVDYVEGSNLTLDDDDYNGLYVCFWATDSLGFVGRNVSEQISGIDISKPVVSNLTVANYSAVNVNVTDINFSVADANLDGVVFYFNGSEVNVTADDGDYNYTTSVLSEGVYNFSIFANDSFGNFVNDTWFFWVDMTEPNVMGVVPVNNSNFSINTLMINFSVVDANLDVVDLYVDGVRVGGLTNESENYTYTASALIDGSHRFSIFSNDSAGNFVNDTWFFVVDVSKPVVSNLTVANYSAVNVNVTDINFSVADANLDGVVFYFNGSEVNVTADDGDYNYTTSVLSEGVYNFSIFANDSFGNYVNDTWFFWVDMTEPNVTMSFVATTMDTTPEITIGVVDNTTHLGWDFVYYVDGVNKKSGVGRGSSFKFNSSSLSVGNHKISVEVEDDAGNVGVSVSKDITIKKESGSSSSSGGSSGGGSSSGGSSGGGGSGSGGGSSGGGSGSRGSTGGGSVGVVNKSVKNDGVDGLKVGERKVFKSVGGVVGSVEVVSNKDVVGAGVRVRDVSGLPKYSDVVDDMVYGLVEVNFSGFDYGDVDEVRLGFSVNKSWVQGKGLNKEDVVLRGLGVDGWQDLGVEFVNETGGKFVYSAVVDADYGAYAVVGVERVVENVGYMKFVWVAVGVFVLLIVLVLVLRAVRRSRGRKMKRRALRR